MRHVISPSTPFTKPVTDRQMAVYNWICAFIVEHEYPPTVREIAKGLQIKSTNGVTDHLKPLVQKGLITRDPNVARGIRIVKREVKP